MGFHVSMTRQSLGGGRNITGEGQNQAGPGGYPGSNTRMKQIRRDMERMDVVLCEAFERIRGP
jgi:hypothetical protein